MPKTTNAFLALGLLALTATTAVAQDIAIQPQATTATYQDWTLRCDHLPESPPRQVCEVAQAVRATDGQSVLAQIVLGRPAPDQKVKLIVQLPAGVWLPGNVTLSAPSGESVTASYTVCQQICVADVDADDGFVEALKAATEVAKLTFQDGNRRPIELPISMNGFTAAISAAAQ